MPQLVPFYFLNEIVFTVSLLMIILYLFSKYILPRLFVLFFCRIALLVEL
jgi:F-type H+-transporting ATPase subunit 8